MKKLVAGIGLALFVTGCSSNGTSPVASVFARPNATSVSVVVRWPTVANASSARRRQYVSNGTKSVTIAVDSGTAQSLDNPNLSPGTANAGTQTSTITLVLAPGSHSFAIGDYDMTGGAGHLLARTTVMATVVQDQANTIGATLDGNLASIDEQAVPNAFLTDAKPTYTVVGPATQTFNLVPKDAAGYVIIAPGAVPTITTTSATPASVSVSATTTANQIFVNALAPDASVVLTAAGKNLDGTAISTPFTLKTLGALYVDDQQNMTVKVFDENGNRITPPGGFPGLSAGIGLTYLPATGSAPGEIIVADSGPSGSGPYFHPYDLLGNAQTVPSGGFPNLKQTGYWRYFPSLGDFYVPGGNKASVYDANGNFVRYVAASAFSAVDLWPGGDSSKGEIFLTGDSVVVGTDLSGAVIAKTAANATTGDPPFTQGNGIVYDSNDGHLFVAGLDGTTGYGTVLEFSTALAETTHLPNAFTDLSSPTAPGIPYPAGIAINPSTHYIYVTNYRAGPSNTQKGMYVFTEAGAATTNVVSGGFSGLSGPSDMVFLP